MILPREGYTSEVVMLKSLLWDILMFIGKKDKEEASKDNKKEPLVRQKKKKLEK